MRKAVALLVLLASAWVGGTDALPTPPPAAFAADVAPGLKVERIVRRGPDLVLHVARLAPGSGYTLRPVLAHDRVGDPALEREPVSDLCRRAGGIVCVNADFAACPTCRTPFGGVVVDRRVLRSFNPAHGQVSEVDGHLTTDMLAWGGTLQARYHSWRELPAVLGQPPRRLDERHEQDALPIAGVNIDPVPDGVVLYTPDWGGSTPATPVQVTIATPVPVAPGSLSAQIVGRTQGPTPLGNDSVLAATGNATGQLSGFADRWLHSNANEKQLALVTAISQPAAFSVGGHPVLLRQGKRQDWDRQHDPKARGRHPRTLLGWNAAGEVLLVTADGRQPGASDGLTLDEAADVLRDLGASEGMNLDGGGSTTFVGPCPPGPCVLNSPSDGRERWVPLALAVVGDRRPVRPVQQTGTALLPPAPPTGEDAASIPHAAVIQPPVAAPAASPATGSPAGETGAARLRADTDARGAARLFHRDPPGPLLVTTPPRGTRVPLAQALALGLAAIAVVTAPVVVGLRDRRRAPQIRGGGTTSDGVT